MGGQTQEFCTYKMICFNYRLCEMNHQGNMKSICWDNAQLKNHNALSFMTAEQCTKWMIKAGYLK